MSAATKSAFLLAATLAMGVILGFTGANALDRRPPRPAPPPPSGGGMVRHMEEVIQPRDSAQRAAIQPVLERAAERNRDIIRRVNDNLRASVDSMRAELAPLLDAQQRARLDEAARRLPPVRGPGAPGGRGGPPPGGRAGDGPPPNGPDGPDGPPPGRRGGGPPP